MADRYAEVNVGLKTVVAVGVTTPTGEAHTIPTLIVLDARTPQQTSASWAVALDSNHRTGSSKTAKKIARTSSHTTMRLTVPTSLELAIFGKTTLAMAVALALLAPVNTMGARVSKTLFAHLALVSNIVKSKQLANLKTTNLPKCTVENAAVGTGVTTSIKISVLRLLISLDVWWLRLLHTE